MNQQPQSHPAPSPWDIGRWLRHTWFDAARARTHLGEDALRQIEADVAASEAQHTGEIRVCIEGGLPATHLRSGATARDRALGLFGTLGVWDTEANNGVLIYVLLADHAIEIVADRGIARHVPPAHWQQVVADMGAAFAAGQFEQGIRDAVARVHRELAAHFPRPAGEADRNELPDAPRVI